MYSELNHVRHCSPTILLWSIHWLYNKPSIHPSISLSDHSGHRRRDRRPMWDSEKLYLTSPPCPPFLYPLSWPITHPSVHLLFSGHRRMDMQIRQVADSRTGSADVLALSIFSLFPALLSSPFLPTLFYLRSSSTQLENRLFAAVFQSIFYKSFCWVLVVSNDLGDNVWLLD